MSVKYRVLVALRGAGRPLAAHQIARLINIDTQKISSSITKLCAYGQIERVTSENDPWGKQRGVYRIRVRDPGYEEWRDQQYGEVAGP